MYRSRLDLSGLVKLASIAILSVASVLAADPSLAALEVLPSLTAAQAVAMQRELNAAIARVDGQKFSRITDKDAALIAAVEQSALHGTSEYGTSTAGPIASVTIAVALSNGVSPVDIGEALGKFAVSLSTCRGASTGGCEAAKSVAQAVANEGTLAMADEFVNAVELSGGSVNLAAIALGNPQVTAAIPGSIAGRPMFGNIVPPLEPPPPCSNPSCN